MFRFAEPQWLYALTAIPLILLVFWLSQRAKTRRLARFGNCSTLAALMPDRSPLREWIKTGVLCAALAFYQNRGSDPFDADATNGNISSVSRRLDIRKNH